MGISRRNRKPSAKTRGPNLTTPPEKLIVESLSLQHAWVSGAEADLLLRLYEREELDNQHKKLSFWNNLNATSTYSVLAAFDSMYLPLVLCPQAALTVDGRMLWKGIEDGFVQSIKWLCEVGASGSILPTDSWQQTNEACEFLAHATDYFDVADFHVSYGRGLARLFVNADSKYVRFDSIDDPQGMVGAGYEEGMYEAVSSAKVRLKSYGFSHEHAKAYLSVAHSVVDGRIVLDSIEPIATAGLHDHVEKSWPTSPREIENDADLDGFSFGKFCSFWNAMTRWSNCAIALYLSNVGRGKPQNECMPTQVVPHDTFMNYTTKLSGLDGDSVEAILNRLTLGVGVSKPEVLLQPFIRSGSSIAWSCHSILASRFHRNMLKLMARQTTLKNRADHLIGGRERMMLREFASAMNQRGYQYCFNKTIGHGEEESEIDILCWTSRAKNQVLVVQWKAILFPDSINEVNEATDRYLEGQQQVRRCIEILRILPRDRLQNLFKFVPWHEVTEIYGVVLSRESGPNQRYDHSQIPASSLATIRARLRNTDFKTPERLRNTLRDRLWVRSLQEGSTSVHKGVKIGSVTYWLPCLQVPKRGGEA